ncbi:MAG TPA: phosphatase PAP2 family protein [Candidatus Baltobacteraceae bacterium]|nr:phosphatase PAP2 family protein [Candidatus Baltobacteraceae bacterium]
MALRIGALINAIVAFGVFVWLGSYVTRGGEPVLFIGWESALLDRSTLIAWWLTWSCYVYALVPIAVALIVVAWRAPTWRGRIAFSLVMLLLCWQGADLAQHFFARPRRLDWVVRHETAFSYPSSHAAIAFGFYGLWAVMIWLSELSRSVRAFAPALLVALVLGICWSRLALGAHYLTDLIGGALLACALLSAGVAVLPLKVFAGPEGSENPTDDLR